MASGKKQSLAQRAKERLHTRAFRSGIVLALLALAAAAAGLAFRGWLHKAGVRRFEAL